MLVIDKRMTKVRSNLQSLYRKLGIRPTKGKFKCKDFEACRRSLRIRRSDNVITGSWPYVGVEYGKALVEGKRLRIAIIGMDAGGVGEASISFQRRQEEWRCAFENATNTPSSPHPTGTALLLQRLVDDKQPIKFARQFAFTNAVKCSPRSGEMTSNVGNFMCQKCQAYLSEEIGLLMPDVVVTQGRYPRDMIRKILKSDKVVFQNSRVTVYRSGQAIVLTTPHPTRHFKWKQGILPRYVETAIGKVRAAVATT